jgi:hypothetical protein
MILRDIFDIKSSKHTINKCLFSILLGMNTLTHSFIEIFSLHLIDLDEIYRLVYNSDWIDAITEKYQVTSVIEIHC